MTTHECQAPVTVRSHQMRTHLAVLVTLIVALLSAPASAASDKYTIELPGRTFVPKPGVEAVLKAQHHRARPRIVQVWEAPDEAMHERLAAAGFGLIRPIQTNVWIARVEPRALWKKLPKQIRWVGEIEPEDKLSTELCEHHESTLSEPILETEPLDVVVEAHPGADTEELFEKLARHGARYRPIRNGERWILRVDSQNLVALAALEEVASVEPHQAPRPRN